MPGNRLSEEQFPPRGQASAHSLRRTGPGFYREVHRHLATHGHACVKPTIRSAGGLTRSANHLLMTRRCLAL